jgi:hypothetical protein
MDRRLVQAREFKTRIERALFAGIDRDPRKEKGKRVEFIVSRKKFVK